MKTGSARQIPCTGSSQLGLAIRLDCPVVTPGTDTGIKDFLSLKISEKKSFLFPLHLQMHCEKIPLDKENYLFDK